VKLLLDENLSDKIVARIVDVFPGSTHVKSEALTHAGDALIADWAKQRGFTIVSKDAWLLSNQRRIRNTAKVYLAAYRQLFNGGDCRSFKITSRADF
jgi:predicted nuclease of predicted toxin-antitoxin system